MTVSRCILGLTFTLMVYAGIVALGCMQGCAVGAPKDAQDSTFPSRTTLAGQYTIVQADMPEGATFSIGLEGPEGNFEVLLTKRNDDAPFFSQTEHCNLSYTSPGQQEGTSTPAGLAAALEDLRNQATEQNLECSGLVEFADPVPMAAGQGSHIPVAALLLVLVLAVVIVWPHSSRRSKAACFWLGVACLTGLAGWLRLHDAGSAFCESAATQRIEIGASPLWQLLTLQMADPRHPPLTTILLHGVLGIGREEYLLRLPFALASVASVPAIAWLSRRVSGQVAALGTCAICAVLLPQVEQGREIGSHALFHLAMPGVLILQARLRHQPTTTRVIVLGLATGAALWAHFIAVFLLLGLLLDGLVFVGRDARQKLLTAAGIGVVVGLVPLVALLRGFATDLDTRHLAAIAPDAVWGDKSFSRVLEEVFYVTGGPLLALLLLFGLVGSLWVLRGSSSNPRNAWTHFALVFAAWIIPIAVVSATPFQRVRGIYATLSLPLISLLAMHALAVLPGQMIERLFGAQAVRARHAMAGVVSVTGIVAFVSLAIATAWRGTPPSVLAPQCVSDTAVVADEIRSTGITHVALTQGHSSSLLGFYLAETVVPKGEAARAPHMSKYGDYSIHNLMAPHELTTDWRPDAELSLAHLVDQHHRILLLDFQHVEPTWPALEQAGGCVVRSVYSGVGLLTCEAASPPGSARNTLLPVP